MSPRESGFGKPKWKREPREIAASSAAPELSQQTPEPFCPNLEVIGESDEKAVSTSTMCLALSCQSGNGVGWRGS